MSSQHLASAKNWCGGGGGGGFLGGSGWGVVVQSTLSLYTELHFLPYLACTVLWDLEPCIGSP